jgi:hypothetical protein
MLSFRAVHSLLRRIPNTSTHRTIFAALLTSVQNRAAHPFNLPKWWVLTARLACHDCFTHVSIPHEIYATDFGAAPHVKSEGL